MSDIILKLLPLLRVQARRLVADPVAADELVERTLLRALDSTDTLRSDIYVEEWLFAMMSAECAASGVVH